MNLRPLLYVLLALGGAVVLLAFLIVLGASRLGRLPLCGTCQLRCPPEACPRLPCERGKAAAARAGTQSDQNGNQT